MNEIRIPHRLAGSLRNQFIISLLLQHATKRGIRPTQRSDRALSLALVAPFQFHLGRGSLASSLVIHHVFSKLVAFHLPMRCFRCFGVEYVRPPFFGPDVAVSPHLGHVVPHRPARRAHARLVSGYGLDGVG